MKTKILQLIWIATFASALGAVAANAPKPGTSSSASATSAESATEMDSASRRIEGERRYRANCGRCHAAPQKFPPRMMATIVRHMRVRATITDEDMRSILYYMSQ
ncbi:MAG TPA: cytochrome c [Terriglobales bacterium]|nr:cytochrome c [Terriglobales bacterium]